MKCCPACFGDRGLRRSIFPLRAQELGRCSYCTSDQLPLLEPHELAEYFELLLSSYRTDPNGKLLVDLFKEDWGIFDHPNIDRQRAIDLLGEILGDDNLVSRTFSPLPVSDTDRLGAWEELKEELMYRNRFFPNANIDLERLDVLLSSLVLDHDEVPRQWFRARIQTSEKVLGPADMGAPPNRFAAHGRANPAGIPYLYVGSTPITAVSEVRPHAGETACVVTLFTEPDLRIIDLRHPKKMVSPFLLADAEDISKLRGDIPFLARLGDELTRPVVPQAAAIEYTPTQYVCEYIKKCGYSGVMYRSSVVQGGINLALFVPELARPGDVSQYRVTRVAVDAEVILQVPNEYSS